MRAHQRLRPGEEAVIDDVYLEAALRGARAAMAEPRIAAFSAGAPEISGLGLGPVELAAAVSAALDGGAGA